MTEIVVDASVALAWCFPDETNDYAVMVLDALDIQQAVVPSIWPLEVANAILVGERRRRIEQSDIRQFLQLLQDLKIQQDTVPAPETVNNVLPLARKYGLSAYDASYLEVALRRSAALATIDARLGAAAEDAGVGIVAGYRKPKSGPATTP